MRASYTTGYPCAREGCGAPALHGIHEGEGYVKYCAEHARAVLDAQYPAGLPVEDHARQSNG